MTITATLDAGAVTPAQSRHALHAKTEKAGRRRESSHKAPGQA